MFDSGAKQKLTHLVTVTNFQVVLSPFPLRKTNFGTAEMKGLN